MNTTAALPSILLVEDDLRLSELIGRYLDNHGFRVSVVNRGDEVLSHAQRDIPDLLILDIGLPGMDGFSLCRRLRLFYANPILILTARGNDIDHVLGLELGADDYVVKPIEPRVLMARVNALLRRRRAVPGHDDRTLRFGRLVINPVARSVMLNDKAVALSATEFDLLAYLASRPGEVQSRETLFLQLYRRNYDGAERIVDVRISHLRRKLGDDGESSERIKTIWGQGYLFVPDAW